jgi:hypothetical protein
VETLTARQAEHQVREHHPDQCADDLGSDVPEQLATAKSAEHRIDTAHDRVQVRARDRTDGEDDRH